MRLAGGASRRPERPATVGLPSAPMPSSRVDEPREARFEMVTTMGSMDARRARCWRRAADWAAVCLASRRAPELRAFAPLASMAAGPPRFTWLTRRTTVPVSVPTRLPRLCGVAELRELELRKLPPDERKPELQEPVRRPREPAAAAPPLMLLRFAPPRWRRRLTVCAFAWMALKPSAHEIICSRAQEVTRGTARMRKRPVITRSSGELSSTVSNSQLAVSCMVRM